VNHASRRGRAAALVGLLTALTFVGAGPVDAAEATTVAVLDFDTSGAPALGKDGGVMAGELLAAALSTRARIRLVERAALRRAMEEQTLGRAGVVDPATAARVQRLVGAQVLVTGRVFAASNRLVVTARAIGTETGHLEAVVVEGRPGDDLRALTGAIADKVVRLLSDRGNAFTSSHQEAPDPVSELARGLAGMRLPRTVVRIRETVLNVEEQHSAAASELTSILLGTSIEVRQVGETDMPAELDEYLARPAAPAGVDVVIFGRALGQFGLRTGDLVSARARVKLTAVDTSTRRVLAVSEMEAKEIDLVPREAAVQAITSATRAAARDFVLKLVVAWNRKPPGGNAGLRAPAPDD
jgi:curli biogenesis system outer membrane secretion channel CsgG